MEKIILGWVFRKEQKLMFTNLKTWQFKITAWWSSLTKQMPAILPTGQAPAGNLTSIFILVAWTVIICGLERC
ncbi:MAG: hypothetical protein CL902_12000 [Dehalococcoidia bacterium]|nr:hypothetical protein [Dehalococcoidia bacterium]